LLPCLISRALALIRQFSVQSVHYWLGERGSISGKDRSFSSPTNSDRICDTPSLLSNGHGEILPWG